jgi:hypothetical protein
MPNRGVVFAISSAENRIDSTNHTTIVTDSRDATTLYQMNADNAVVSLTDALQAVTGCEYADSSNKVAEAAPIMQALGL